ncbi:MAG: hypothetical protein K0Q77_1676 [Anaerosporomusa subterranea]|nr:hypothetical protein [Anaerosporomusa subterranea]
MNEILTLIDDIQSNIFAYKIELLSKQVIQLSEEMATWVSFLSENDQNTLNIVLNAILASYEKKDYLMLADLMEFELKRLVLDNMHQ